MKIVNRIISLPYIVVILFLNHMYLFISHVWHFARFGGEMICYHSKGHEKSLKSKLDKIVEDFNTVE
jgi:hypothetical protein